MAANRFLTEVDLEFTGNFDQIAEQANTALRKISSAARTSVQNGEGTAGLAPAVHQVATAATRAGLVAGIGPKEIAQLQRIFTDFHRQLQTNVKGYNAKAPDVQREAVRLLQQQGVRERNQQAQAGGARQKLAAQYEALAAKTKDDVQAEAKLIVLKQQQAKALAEQVAQLQGRSAGPFQRALFRTHAAGGFGGAGGGLRTAADEATLSQFVGRHAINTLGYAIPGIAIGIGFEEIRRSVEEAQLAQRAMSELRAEFEGLGQSDQFSGFASSVKQIAADTGVAVSEVTQLAIAMKGVYGDTGQATIATRAMAEATVTMGLSLREAQQDLIAVTQGFNDLKSQGGGATVTVQNEALHLQDITGVEAKDLLPGLADVASTAQAAGFNSTQTASIIAAAAQHSGLSSATIGETLSKIITSLSSNPQLLVQTERYLQGVPGSGVKSGIASQSISTQIQGIFGGLADVLGTPGTSSQYSYILSQLGINSSALPAANAIFSTGAEARQLAGSAAPSNRAQQEFNKQMDTLSGRTRQLEANFTNLGVQILNSDFGKSLTETVKVFGELIGDVTHLHGAAKNAADTLLGIAGTAAAIAAFAKALSIAGKTLEIFTVATRGATAGEEVQAAGGFGVGLSGAGAAVGSRVPQAAIAAIAGYLSYKGTTAVLDDIFGKPKSYKPTVHSTKQADDFVKNFVKEHGADTLALAGKFGTPNDTAIAQSLIDNKDNLGLLRFYNRFFPNPQAQALVQQLAVQRTFAAAAKDPQVAAYLKAQAALASTKTALDSPYLHALAAANIENTDVNAAPGGYETGALSYNQAYGALSGQTSGALSQFQANPSAPGFEAYVQAQQAQIQFAYQGIATTQAVATANAHEDPLAIARAAQAAAESQKSAVLAAGGTKSSSDYQQAQAAATTAAQQVADQQNAISQAQTGLTKAYDTAAGDVVAQAKDDQAKAAEALAIAHGQAEKLQAQAQQVAADREVVTAMNDIATAQAALLTAMANATGDPQQIIAAARKTAATSLSNANRIKAADEALHKDPNQDKAFTDAMTQYYNDQANVANTIAQQTINQTETLLFLGRETATQAIANLEAALPQVKGNVQATNQLLTEIRQIQLSASNNLNFDLPSTLFNANLYQARSIEAGGTAGQVAGAPQSVTVTINVNGGTTSQVDSAVSKLTAAVAGPQRTGTIGPLLSGTS